MRIVRETGAAALAALVVVGTSPVAAAQPPASTTLMITYREDRNARAQRWALTCDPVLGSHPKPAQACGTLMKLRERGVNPFAPVPPDAICTLIYGGSQTATVTGFWNEEPVDASFNRVGGCEIARWDAIAPVIDPLHSR